MGQGQVWAQPVKVQALKQAQQHVEKKGLQRFLGLASY